MATVLEHVEIEPRVLHLPRTVQMTDEQFLEFCCVNDYWRMERTSEGDILVMPPEGGSGSSRNSELNAQLRVWAKRDGSGAVFDSSAGFKLPSTAVRGPDAAWVLKKRLRKLTAEEKEGFLPLCPDFVVEQLSPWDRLATAKEKMQEYLENGLRLGWLIDPRRRHVYIYRPHTRVERLDSPDTLSGDPVLPGFVLDLGEIWDPGF
jgi:Uma2 family endonuclease